jgi:xylulose-5-phosphate/fructose-6-phosphate phosphoketolase
VFDNPDLIVTCVVGDGEAETGPLATSWHSNKFLNPVTDGAVLPILHLNGYKIAGPTVLARIEPEELDQLLKGYGWTPHYVEGDDPAKMHRLMADTMDTVIAEIKAIQADARANGFKVRPRWPMIVLKSPKGWTGPDKVDGKQILGTFRPPGAAGRGEDQPQAHQDPGGLAPELQARRAVRRGRQAAAGAGRAGAQG